MSRDTKRIPDVLDAVRQVWIKNPDMRLGQLMENMSRGRDLFLIEDEVMIADLKKMLQTGEWPGLAPMPDWIPCCDHCGCKLDRSGHDDSCREGCNDR